MVYGSGEGQNTKHYYAGSKQSKTTKKEKGEILACKKKPGKK